MELINLKELLETLRITSFEDIDKYKAIQIAEMFPKISENIFQTVLEQVPNFFHLLELGLEAQKEVILLGLKNNDENMKSLNEKFEIVFNILRTCQEKPNLTFEESRYYIDKTVQLLEMITVKDTENKEFIKRNIKAMEDANKKSISTALGVLVGFAGIGLIALGTVTNNQFLVQKGADKTAKKVVEIADKKGLIK